ncbi:MAG: hypothetical protein FWD81_05090 [Methanomassiliicoccaceae archaeon]|nr:hypothetical protein [Methanomassiliicoccaceae archaeon]
MKKLLAAVTVILMISVSSISLVQTADTVTDDSVPENGMMTIGRNGSDSYKIPPMFVLAAGTEMITHLGEPVSEEEPSVTEPEGPPDTDGETVSAEKPRSRMFGVLAVFMCAVMAITVYNVISVRSIMMTCSDKEEKEVENGNA